MSAPLSARIALVGPEFARSENLGLRVLAASLRADGHQPVIVPLTSPIDFEDAAHAIVQDGPDGIGISITYEGSAWLLSSFPRRLRELGFEGPIVAGGPFATLHAEDLLSAASGLDGVIRHDGEVAIVRFAEAAIGRRELGDIPGIVLRSGAGLCDGGACDFSRFDIWPWRGPDGLPKHLGLPTADLVASRGCDRSCAYCSVAALRADANARRSVLEEIGLGETAVRRRTVEDLCDEMGSLVFEYGARVFEFQDDTFLPDPADEAVLFVQELRREMAVRGMPKCALTVKVRADQVTREVCDELAKLGVVRAFVGIEALSRAMARRIGRQMSSVPARVSLGRLRRLGIATYFNSLAIGPEASLSDVEEEIEALSTVRGVPFEIVRLVAYGGTDLTRRLEEEGRLKGCAFLRTYTYSDDSVARLADAMSRIVTRHFGRRCPAKRVADLCYNLALAKRFYARARLAPIERTTARLVSRVNTDQVTSVSALIDAIRRGAAAKQIDQIVYHAVRRDVDLYKTIGDVATVLEREVQAAGGDCAHVYFRGQVAPIVASAMVAASGCSDPDVRATRAAAGMVADPLSSTSEVPLELESIFEVDDCDTAEMDSPLMDDSDVEQSCEVLAAKLLDSAPPPSSPNAGDDVAYKSQLMQPRGEYGYFRATVKVSESGAAELVELVGALGHMGPTEPVFACVANLMSNLNLSCFAGETVVFEDPGPMD